MRATQIDVGPEEKLEFIVGCHSTSDSTLYENITGPEEEWYGNKWFFDGATWTLNADWVDPREEISE